MPDEKPRVDTSKLKEKAEQAVTRHNFPYAMELYQQIVSLDPDDVDSRKALRALSLRHQQETGASGFSVLLKNLVPYIKLKFPSKDPDKVMQEAERYLAQDPNNYKVTVRLGQAARQAGYLATARWVFEDALRIKPNDVAALRQLQDVCRQTGDIRRALEINQQILKVAPNDVLAARAVKDLQADSMSRKLTDAGVLEAQRGKAARQIVRDETEFDLKRQRISELRTDEEVQRVIEYTRQDIEKRPDDPQLHVKLGDLYLRLEDWDNARNAYAKARQLSPTQYTIIMREQDLELRLRRAELRKLQDAYRRNPQDAQARAAYAKTYDDFLNLRLEYFIDREKNIPTELKIVFELGNIFFELNDRRKQVTGKHDERVLDEAIARYQRTVKDPGVRFESQLRLGQCFLNKAQYELAIRQFSEAIDALEFMNDQKKDLIYNRAKAFLATGSNEQAKKDLLTIYEVDIDYKDVAELVKKL